MDERTRARLTRLRVFGLVLGGLLGVERAWMKGARAAALLNSYVLLTLLYYLLLVPCGLLLRLAASDPLDRLPDGSPSYWRKRKTGGDPTAYERQF